jgi:hypothetical protein
MALLDGKKEVRTVLQEEKITNLVGQAGIYQEGE